MLQESTTSIADLRFQNLIRALAVLYICLGTLDFFFIESLVTDLFNGAFYPFVLIVPKSKMAAEDMVRSRFMIYLTEMK
jgi:hypothetical protein